MTEDVAGQVDEAARQELRRELRRVWRLVDDGKIDDHTVAFVQSFEERLDAGRLDDITLAEVDRLGRLGH